MRSSAVAGWMPRSGWAEPVAHDAYPAIPAATSVRLLSEPLSDAPCGVEAAAGAIPVGSSFAVRFYAGAARRVVLACRSAAAAPGGGELLACELVQETAAPERRHARHVVDVQARGTVRTSEAIPAGTQLDVRILNVSASGAMIAALAEFGPGDIVVVELSDGPAALEVFRRDPQAGCFGARFADHERGRTAVQTLLAQARG